MATQTTQRIINWLSPIGFFALIIAVWEFLVRMFSIPQYLLPAPSAIAIDFIFSINSLLFHAGITLWEAFLGFLIANTLGVLVAIAFAYSKTLEKGLYPFAIALNDTNHRNGPTFDSLVWERNNIQSRGGGSHRFLSSYREYNERVEKR